MVEGLKLTFSGEELRTLLEARIDHHGASADRWAHEKTRTSADETEDAPRLPEHMCANEAERHTWRANALRFIRDHLEPAETYRLCAADLEIGEIFPLKPECLTQAEDEEHNRVGCTLERMTNGVERLVTITQEHLWRQNSRPSTGAPAPGIVADTDEFRTTRLDLGDGPEVTMIERK